MVIECGNNFRNENDKSEKNIEWKFELPEKKEIEKVIVTVNSATFESGKVLWVSN